MALMCQRVVSQLRNPLRNGSLAMKIGVLKFWGFRSPFRSCEMKGGLRNGTRVPMGGFVATKIFAERGHGAEKSFCSQGAFSQPRPDFVVCFLGLQNYFAAKGHFRKGFLLAAKSRRP